MNTAPAIANAFTILKKIPSNYKYHNITHTMNVIAAVKILAKGEKIPTADQQVLEVAAAYHDTGYIQGPTNHEARGASIAESELQKFKFSPAQMSTIKRLILATHMPYKPKDILEKIMCDADMGHLGVSTYFLDAELIRQEIEYHNKKHITQKEWFKNTLQFLKAHHYFTKTAKKLYLPQKKITLKETRAIVGIRA
ncbi:MAG: HD domain-containing protein [Candidatus Woesearchaeota archaeon]